MRLIYTASQVNVMVGDTCYLRDGQEVTVQSFAKPHKASSSGKVYVATVGSPVYRSEYFVGVIGAEWIEREDRAAEDDVLLLQLNTPALLTPRQEAIATADAYLNNAGLPNYTALQNLLKEAQHLGLEFDIGSAYIRRSYITQQDSLKCLIAVATAHTL